MKRVLSLRLLSLVGLISLLLIGVFGCRKDMVVSSTTTSVNLTTYLKQHPETFSELTKILERTETASFLNAYGSYTLFAPTNTAIKAYLQKTGRGAIEDVDTAELKSLVRFHLLEDSLSTTQFTDGKLPSLTMYGQYLVTGASNSNGETKYTVNKQANIVAPNISVGNGLIHVIDNVLTPSAKTVAQILAENPRYSMFVTALKQTGVFDTLNMVPAHNKDFAEKLLTVLAESNDALGAAGFDSVNNTLLKRYSKGDPKQPGDSLHLWVDYHILNKAKYIADIISESAHTTLAPLEILTTKREGESLIINQDTSIKYPGFGLNRNYSDLTATNGVVHEASSHFKIIFRSPQPIYYDICTSPDFIKMSSIYKKKDYFFLPAEASALSDIKAPKVYPSNEIYNTLTYRYGSGNGTSKESYNKDILVFPLGGNNFPEWTDIKLPLVVKGKYKVWVCIFVQAQTSGTCEVQAFLRPDGSDSLISMSNSRVISFTVKRPGLTKTVNGVKVPDADGEEALGFKSYMESTAGAQIGRLAGVVDIKQTGRYWLRLKVVNGSQGTNNIDMIHLIPLGMDQQYPRFKTDGTVINRP